MNDNIITELNQTEADFPKDLCIHQLIDANAKQQPSSVAVVFENDQITYGELEKRSNQLANYLKKMGVGPETLVAVCMKRSSEMLIAALGIQKAGGAYVPLEPSFPAKRINLVLDDTDTRIIVTMENQKDLIDTGLDKICLDSDWSKISKEKSTIPDSGVKSNNLAYVIYTSGSTGKPKGVQIEHRSVVNFLKSMQKEPGINKQDILLAVTTLTFDISVLELYLPLICGAKVVILAEEKTADGKALIEAIEKNEITVMQATPASWRLMLDCGWEGNTDLKILCGGEPLPMDLAKAIIPKCKELWNMYGPTESTVWSTCTQIKESSNINIGRPIDNTTIYILNDKLQLQTVGVEGELMIGGDGLARGYLNLPELTTEKFISHPFKKGHRLYRTGDIAKYQEDGSIDCLGRSDDQIKLHGFRIELGEIEKHLLEIDGISRSVVTLREDQPGKKRLVAYYMGKSELATDILRQALLANLPDYFVPSVFVWVKNFPLNSSGKVDRKAFPPPHKKRPSLAQDFIEPQTEIEKKLAQCWCKILEVDKVGIDDNFFDLGGSSILAAEMVSLWQKYDDREIPLVKVFQYPSISLLNKWLDHEDNDDNLTKKTELRTERLIINKKKGLAQTPVAIVGMAGRFPGADNLDKLWQNLCNEVESISVFRKDELGIGIEEWLRNDPDYIPARGIIEGAELFDPLFFGISPLEASIMDPQQRVFLELAYQLLENAGYDPERYPGLIGVYAGVGDNHYYSINVLSNPDIIAQAGKLMVEYGNEKDYIALRVAYALGLNGPAVSANTACSTSLLAVDNAIQGLSNYDCDLALAGGIDISIPQKSGFLYTEGGTFAKDGHCRPFDADATGTMFCDGAGIVALKRLDDALDDGDKIYAVIRGSAKNNNGSRPASFLAPSIDGQAEVVALAQARASIPLETIGYIEAHGTGTPLGDPIEVEALTKVFREKTQKKQFCYIGSIKGHVGHPTNAAGIAGLIKAALVLYKEQIPPTLHYKKSNPKIDFGNSPFKVADKLVSFPRGKTPRRTAVSSFGFGGTNLHAILEEAPLAKPTGPSRPLQLITISAKTASALDSNSQNLADHFANCGSDDFPDAAFTLIQGRKHFSHRKIVVASNYSEAAELLLKPIPSRSAKKHITHRDSPVVFLFGGQGTQYINMGLNLYQDEPLFRTLVDECCQIIEPYLKIDLRDIIFPSSTDYESAAKELQNTCYTQPAIFIIEYAIARLWQSLGIEPELMVGHSVGEFVAATIAGVFELPDALRIVAKRGQLMQSIPKGSMLSVRTGLEEISELLPSSIQMAAINAPSLCVVSGTTDDITALQGSLESKEIVCRLLQTSHAFHSAMMDPILDPLREEFADIELKSPKKKFISTVTGVPIKESQACDPEYWVLHARKTVQFSSAITWILENNNNLFLECGPRASMCTLTRQHVTPEKPISAIPSMSSTSENDSEREAFLMAIGKLWLEGISIEWDVYYANEQRQRVPLPTYSFEKKRCWIEPGQNGYKLDTKSLDSKSQTEQEPVVNLSNSTAKVDNLSETTLNLSRKDQISTQLVKILEPVWGNDASLLDVSATFLEQGFDSLSLTQVANGIRKEFGVKVSFGQLMKDYPNIEMLSDYIDENIADDALNITPVKIAEPDSDRLSEEKSASSSGENSKRIEDKIEDLELKISRLTALIENPKILVEQKTAVDNRYKTTIPQRGIYFSSRLSDNLSACYNESVTIIVKGTINSDKIKKSINRLVERHDALTASFDESGKIMQIHPGVQLGIEQKNFTHIEKNHKEDALKILLSEETSTPFSLPQGPLFRSKIIELEEDVAAIVFTGHHTICDGWSLDVLIHNFCTFYSEEITGNNIKLSEVMSYGEYVQTVSEREENKEFKEAKDFWLNKFADGFPALILQSDRPRTGFRKFKSKRKERIISSKQTNMVRSFAANHGWSFFSLVLATYSILLARISKQRNFVISLPTAEQPIIGQPDLVGHCVNMIPFVVNLEKEDTIETFIMRIQEELSRSHNHSVFTLTHLLQQLSPSKPKTGITPITAGITSVKKYHSEELPQNGFTVDYDINEKNFESFEWYISALEVEEELVLRANYDMELFNDSTADKWLDDFCDIIENISSNPSAALNEFAKISDESTKGDSQYLFLLTDNKNGDTLTNHTEITLADISNENQQLSYSSKKEIEVKLTKIWQELLNNNNINPNDSFFDLGGNSMDAAQLFEKIEDVFNKRLPLASLFPEPTIDSLSNSLCQKVENISFQSLVPLQPKGNLKPIFGIHSTRFHYLAKYLGADRPIYGLRYGHASENSEDFLSLPDCIEDLASNYIEEMQVIQPEGPYYLIGSCIGALVAFEMANQLVSKGEQIGALVLADPLIAKAKRPISLKNKIINIKEIGATEVIGRVREQVVRKIRKSKGKKSTRAQFKYSDHEPQTVYPGKAIIIKTVGNVLLSYNFDPELGWRELIAGGIDIYEIKSTHTGVFDEPAVQEFTNILKKYIAQ